MLSDLAAILSIPLIGLTLLPLIKSGNWWIRIWDFPRQQLATALGVALAIQIAAQPESFIHEVVLGLSLLALIWQVWRIYPYTPAQRVEVKSTDHSRPEHRIRLLIANVYQENRQVHAFMRCIATFDPDVVLIVEANAWWQRHLAALQQRFPYSVCRPLENTYGMLLFSRLELENAEILERVTKDIPSIVAHVKLRSGKIIEMHCLHPEPPVVGADVDERDAELLLVAREAARSPYPVIVCGDMNDVAWSHTTRLFQRISGLLDPRIGRGLFSTFDANRWYARWPLDHIFHSPQFLLRRIEVGGHIGSDHFPIFAELVYEPAAEEFQQVPEAGAEDHHEAARKIAEGRKVAMAKATETAVVAE